MMNETSSPSSSCLELSEADKVTTLMLPDWYKYLGTAVLGAFVVVWMVTGVLGISLRKRYPLNMQPCWLGPLTGVGIIMIGTISFMRMGWWHPDEFPCDLFLICRTLYVPMQIGPYCAWILDYQNRVIWSRRKRNIYKKKRGMTEVLDKNMLKKLLSEKRKASGMYAMLVMFCVCFIPGIAVLVYRVIQESDIYFQGKTGCNVSFIDFVIFCVSGAAAISLLVFLVLYTRSAENKHCRVWKRLFNRSMMLFSFVTVYMFLAFIPGLSDCLYYRYSFNKDIVLPIMGICCHVLDCVCPILTAYHNKRRGVKVVPSLTADEVDLSDGSILQKEKQYVSITLRELIQGAVVSGLERHINTLEKFQEQLVEEYCVENVAFLKLVECFRHNPNISSKDAKRIYDCFIADDGLTPVNIDFMVQGQLKALFKSEKDIENNFNAGKITTNTFDLAYDEVCSLLEGDSYSRFLGWVAHQQQHQKK